MYTYVYYYNIYIHTYIHKSLYDIYILPILRGCPESQVQKLVAQNPAQLPLSFKEILNLETIYPKSLRYRVFCTIYFQNY